MLALGALACQKDKPQPTEAEPDPSAWFAPASASGLSALPDTAPSAEAEPAKVDSDGIVEAPVRRVRPKDMPPIAPAPTERGKDPKTASIDAVMGSYGFPVHKSLKHLCAGRVMESGGGHVTWDAFTSTEPPSALLSAYTSRLGEKGYSDDKGGGTWRLPAGSKPPMRVLSILAAADGGPHRGCEEKPPADAKSVIIASRGEIDIAIGVIIGAAFNKVVDVLVKEVFLPPLSLLTNGTHWSDKKIVLREAVITNGSIQTDEIAPGYGKLIEAGIDFFIIGFTVFLVVKLMNSVRNKAQDPKDPTETTPKDIELLHRTTELLEQQVRLLEEMNGRGKG